MFITIKILIFTGVVNTNAFQDIAHNWELIITEITQSDSSKIVKILTKIGRLLKNDHEVAGRYLIY